MLELGNGAAILYIGSITAGAENATDFHGLVRVGGGNESPSSVIDQGSDGDRKPLDKKSAIAMQRGARLADSLLQGRLKLWHDIMSLNTIDIKAFGPSLQHTMIDVFLGRRVRECEA